MAVARRAVELARTLRAQAGLRVAPAARAARGSRSRTAGIEVDAELLELIARRDQRQGGRA